MNQISNVQPLRGWVSKFFVIHGAHKHGPYYARCWKHNGKLKKEYIKQNDVEQTRAACDAYREKQRRRSEKGRELKQIIANLSYLQRMERRSTKDALRPQDHAHLNRIETLGPTADGHPKLWKRTRSTPITRQRSESPSPEPRAKSPKTFMYPSNKSSFQAFLDNIWKKANREKRSCETPVEKWARWKKDRRRDPPLPHIVAPQKTIDREELDSIIHETCLLIQGARKPGVVRLRLDRAKRSNE